MKHLITIKKTLIGKVEIEADNAKSALKQADERFNQNGEALPEMEDSQPLMFESDPAPWGIIGSNMRLGDEIILDGLKYKIQPVYIGEVKQ